MSESVQLAVLFPLIIGIFLLLLQWALVTWARSTALSAAQESAAAAALVGGSEAEGAAAGRAALNASLARVSVSVDRGGRLTTAVVRGNGVSILWRYQVVETASAPTQRVTDP